MWSRAWLVWLLGWGLAGPVHPGRQSAPQRHSPFLLEQPSSSLYLIASPHYQPDNQLQVAEDEDEDEGAGLRGKRSGASLSIVEPIDVLRNRVLMQMARQRFQKQNENQVIANKMFLQAVGKRHAYRDRPLETGEFYKSLGEPDWDSS